MNVSITTLCCCVLDCGDLSSWGSALQTGRGQQDFQASIARCNVGTLQTYEYNAENLTDHPLYVYEALNGTIKRITCCEVRPAIHRAAKFALNAVGNVTKDTNFP